MHRVIEARQQHTIKHQDGCSDCENPPFPLARSRGVACVGMASRRNWLCAHCGSIRYFTNPATIDLKFRLTSIFTAAGKQTIDCPASEEQP